MNFLTKNLNLKKMGGVWGGTGCGREGRISDFFNKLTKNPNMKKMGGRWGGGVRLGDGVGAGDKW